MRNKATSSFGYFCSIQNHHFSVTTIFDVCIDFVFLFFSPSLSSLFIFFFQFKAPIGNLISWIWLKSKWTMTVRLAHHWIFGIYFAGNKFNIFWYDKNPILPFIIHQFTRPLMSWCQLHSFHSMKHWTFDVCLNFNLISLWMVNDWKCDFIFKCQAMSSVFIIDLAIWHTVECAKQHFQMNFGIQFISEWLILFANFQFVQMSEFSVLIQHTPIHL